MSEYWVGRLTENQIVVLASEIRELQGAKGHLTGLGLQDGTTRSASADCQSSPLLRAGHVSAYFRQASQMPYLIESGIFVPPKRRQTSVSAR